MAATERLIALKACLHGSRRKIYDNMHKVFKGGPGEYNHESVYVEVKARLMKFTDTSLE